jgi:DNA-damage-inducible protein J
MAQTTLSIRMDENVKKQFDAFCSEVGMNTSVAINLFAKAVLREGKIPFEISANDDPFYSDANKARLKKSINALNVGKGSAHELIGADDD